MSANTRMPRRAGPALRDILTSATALSAAYLDETGYGLAYGSHIDGSATATSDLDLLLVGTTALPPDRMRALTDGVIRLHHRHGLDLDQEVSYENKLHATTAEVQEAVALGGFGLTADGGVIVDAVVAEPWFLDSHAFKLRLVLNALTIPHVFLGGDLHLYEHHRVRAERATALLALSLMGDREDFTVRDAVEVLLGDPGGPHGKDFLGHDERACRVPALFSALQRSLAALTSEGVVSTITGIRLRQHTDRRQVLLRQLAACVVETSPCPPR